LRWEVCLVGSPSRSQISLRSKPFSHTSIVSSIHSNTSVQQDIAAWPTRLTQQDPPPRARCTQVPSTLVLQPAVTVSRSSIRPVHVAGRSSSRCFCAATLSQHHVPHHSQLIQLTCG
jgi:hypothetical protein